MLNPDQRARMGRPDGGALWIALALLAAGTLIAWCARLFWRHRCRASERRVQTAAAARRPYHCLTIRLPPEWVQVDSSIGSRCDANVPAVWRKTGAARKTR